MPPKFNRFLLIALLFALMPLARGQTFELLHSFQDPNNFPLSQLMQASDGNFYGTTLTRAFKVTPSGALTTLVSFQNTNGIYPLVGLLQGNNGDLYGTTSSGGDLSLNGGSGFGTVFRMTTNGALTTLVLFNDTNGANPRGLVQATDGNFYGITVSGGAYHSEEPDVQSFGTVFKMTPDGVLTTLVSFDGTNGVGPIALIQAIDGDFYGTCGSSDTYPGSVFRMTSNGTITSLFSFDDTGNGNYSPRGLIQASDGNLYGTTLGGNRGNVFRMTKDGQLTNLASFGFASGYHPYSGVIQGRDGNFYGTAALGAGNFGSVFQMKPNGILTTLFSFHGYDGGNPYGGLVQGNDSNFYGTTYTGGVNNFGTIFRIVMSVNLNSRLSGNDLVLSWPTNALAFTLQSAVDLNSPIDWIDSTNTPAVVGAQFTVTNSLSASARFYRLKKP